MKSFALALMMGLLPLAASAGFGADALSGAVFDPSGNWVLCQDEDNSPKDALEFFPEGYGFERRLNHQKAPFLYDVSGGRIPLTFIVTGKLFTLDLTLNPEHTKLTLTSKRTGHVAFYVRSGQEKKFGCTAR